MPAYVIVEVEVTNPVVYEDYKRLAQETIHRYGGRYIVRGGKTEVLEGEASKRMIVLEFPTFDKAKTWYRSPEYAYVKTLRERSATSRLMIVEGLETPPQV